MPALDGLSPTARAAWGQSFLAALPARAGDALLETAVEMRADSGHTIYRGLDGPGTPFLGLVTHGLVRVFVSSARGREVTIRHIKRGDVTGLPAAVAGGAPHGVQAVTRCGLLALPVRTLHALAGRDPMVAWAVSHELTKIILAVTEVLTDNVFNSISERVARTLLERARIVGGVLVVNASQQAIADEIGPVREVVARAIHQFRIEGLIDRRGQQIVLLDPGSLRRLVDQEAVIGRGDQA